MESSIHSYEDVRRKRIEKNLKQLEDLGIAKISKSLLEVAKRESKQLKIHTSFKAKKLLETSELRRSSRMQKEAPSYCDDVVDSGNRRLHGLRSSRSEPIGREYTGRIASYEQKVLAQKRAEMLLNQLSTDHPSFVKLMLRSHVSSCFWLGLPTKFCRDHLPLRETKMILEDEEGEEHEAIYIGRRTGLSGGWRSFAVDHKLEDGDALVFKLIGLTRFKIYIVKAIVGSTEAKDEKARFKKPCASTELKETEDSSCENPSSIITIHVPKDKSEELPRKCIEAKAKET
uniref:Putative B3 domain-containing protein isoform X2 n=1 Tax=Cymbidium sinense TaxID=112615 RepID=A0A5J6SC58_9ASPA|nr:putative B3 domain-containing protein isoform X2 [Cymbidium sinense]